VKPDSRTRLSGGHFGGSSWEVAQREVPQPLRPYVRRLVGYSERAPQPVRAREFPGPDLVVILEFGPPLAVAPRGDSAHGCSSPGGFVAGLGDAFAEVSHAGLQRGIQIDLSPAGGRRLFGLPLAEISHRVVPLVELLPGCLDSLRDQLAHMENWSSRLDLVESFLSRRILTSPLDSRRIDWAVDRIHASRGRLEIGQLRAELGISHKHLISLFREHVGIPPKLLARLVRFQSTLESLRSERAAASSLAELSLELGFFDQAHLTREVRHFTGLTPSLARGGELSGPSELFG